MADFGKAQSKKKKPNRFGTPPSIEEASNNLEAPEHAPTAPEKVGEAPKKKTVKKKAVKASKPSRTVPFNHKVTPEFEREFKMVALEDRLKLVELLEASFQAYKKARPKKK